MAQRSLVIYHTKNQEVHNTLCDFRPKRHRGNTDVLCCRKYHNNVKSDICTNIRIASMCWNVSTESATIVPHEEEMPNNDNGIASREIYIYILKYLDNTG